MVKKGLFVGLITLDLIYLAEAPPVANQKIVAQETAIAAGGPATNAAVAFRALGNSATILGALGQHPIAQFIRTDLENCGVAIADLHPTRPDSPPVSSIVVTQATGDRAVVSRNAVKAQLGIESVPSNILDEVDIVLIDGHQMQIGAAIAKDAKQKNIPVVMDGGSWKSGFETVFPFVDYAICSANFKPPTDQTVIECLTPFGISHIAVTRGKDAIEAWHQTSFQLEVPQVSVVDTLGAGDFFHGAFCHYILETDFATALSNAAKIAADACQFFGTRSWLETLNNSRVSG